jgi:hypothetical protein
MEGQGARRENVTHLVRECVRSSMYPSAANPAAMTTRRMISQALSPTSILLVASSRKPRAMVKYHQA